MEPLPEGWERFETDDGEEYFHNAERSETVWDRPTPAGAAPLPRRVYVPSWDQWWEERQVAAGATYYHREGQSVWQLPGDVSVWECGGAAVTARPSVAAARAAPAGASGGDLSPKRKAMQQRRETCVRQTFQSSMTALKQQQVFRREAPAAPPQAPAARSAAAEAARPDSQFAQSLENLRRQWDSLKLQQQAGAVPATRLHHSNTLQAVGKLDDNFFKKRDKARGNGPAARDAQGAPLRLEGATRLDLSLGEASAQLSGGLQLATPMLGGAGDGPPGLDRGAPWDPISFPGIAFLCFEEAGGASEIPAWGSVHHLSLGLVIVAWEGIEMMGPRNESGEQALLRIPYDKIIFWTEITNATREEYVLDLTMEGDYSPATRDIEYWTGHVLDMRIAVPDELMLNTLCEAITQVCKLYAGMVINQQVAHENFSKSKVANASLEYIKGTQTTRGGSIPEHAEPSAAPTHRALGTRDETSMSPSQPQVPQTPNLLKIPTSNPERPPPTPSSLPEKIKKKKFSLLKVPKMFKSKSAEKSTNS